jgi:hypothetical protein
MEQMTNQERLLRHLKKKEIEAEDAKKKGMISTYGNLLLEINLVKTKLKKFNMGSR